MTQDTQQHLSKWQKAFTFKDNFRSIYTRQATHYASIDGIRAISIILVLIFHVFFVFMLSSPGMTADKLMSEVGIFWHWALNGDRGVDVFFVMSGFLISGILLREYSKTQRIDLKRFYLRRYLRLTPAYYFTLTLYWLIDGPHSEWIWANFLYISNYIHYSHQAVGWTWSLAIEEQFYFIYPLVLIALLKFTKSPGLHLILLLVISFFVRAWVVLTDDQISDAPFSLMYLDKDFFNHFFTVLYDNLHTRFGSLVVGCLAAYGFHVHQQALIHFFNSFTGVITTLLGISLILIFMIIPTYLSSYDGSQVFHVFNYIFSRNLFSIGIGILILAMLLQQHVIAKGIRWFLSLPFWYPFATLSYSLYLIHLVVMVVVIPAMVNLTMTMPESYPWTTGEVLFYSFLVSTILSLFLSALMYLFIEKPIMNLR
jgi:peptidoglycan/LPS O-acetylase OafA/YrhL